MDYGNYSERVKYDRLRAMPDYILEMEPMCVQQCYLAGIMPPDRGRKYLNFTPPLIELYRNRDKKSQLCLWPSWRVFLLSAMFHFSGMGSVYCGSFVGPGVGKDVEDNSSRCDEPSVRSGPRVAGGGRPCWYQQQACGVGAGHPSSRYSSLRYLMCTQCGGMFRIN